MPTPIGDDADEIPDNAEILDDPETLDDAEDEDFSMLVYGHGGCGKSTELSKPRCTCNAYTTKFWAATRCNGQLLGAQDLDDLEKGWKRLTGDPLDRAGAYEVLVFKYRQETFTKETGVDAA